MLPVHPKPTRRHRKPAAALSTLTFARWDCTSPGFAAAARRIDRTSRRSDNVRLARAESPPPGGFCLRPRVRPAAIRGRLSSGNRRVRSELRAWQSTLIQNLLHRNCRAYSAGNGEESERFETVAGDDQRSGSCSGGLLRRPLFPSPCRNSAGTHRARALSLRQQAFRGPHLRRISEFEAYSLICQLEPCALRLR